MKKTAKKQSQMKKRNLKQLRISLLAPLENALYYLSREGLTREDVDKSIAYLKEADDVAIEQLGKLTEPQRDEYRRKTDAREAEEFQKNYTDSTAVHLFAVNPQSH